ncbi:MAG: helix-turn-helix transcriptional regulator [Rubrivivax sp.]|nr:helix-turn-helix transcriptional regulator [Rubrivivax sp.]
MTTAPRGIHLGYTFEARGQVGAEIENPLFDLLSALREQGSISQVARATGQSYRHLWGSLKQWEQILGNPLVQWTQGKHARLTPFAERLLWAERQARVRMTPHVEALRRELQRVFAIADDATQDVLELAASHDLALPMLQTLVEAEHRVHLDVRFTGSEDALRSLLDGRCRIAGFHVPRLVQGASVFKRALRPLLEPGTHKLIGSHWRRQGLMHRSDTPPPSLAGLGRPPSNDAPRLRFVNRQPGSGTRLLLEHLLAQVPLDASTIDGFDSRVEHTHLAVALAVACGAADVGLGIEAAARAHGLAFVPLVEEDYFLVCLKPTLDSPPIDALRSVLATPAWAAALQTLAGYGVQRPGQVLSLTGALPWWRFTRPKRS